MHIPDGYLGPATAGGLWAAALPFWAAAARRLGTLPVEGIPRVAMGSVFSLLVMTAAVPLPGGTTAHLCGTAAAAVLLGPWVAILAVSVALAVQALVLGSGGLLALGANAFNLAVAGCFSAHLAHRAFLGLGRRLGLPWTEAAASGAAGYVSVNVSAFLTAWELGLQPRLAPGFFPHGPGVTLAALMGVHLTVLGALEAVMTALVVAAVRGRRTARPLAVGMGALAFVLFSRPARSHEFRFEPAGKGFAIVYGHGSQRADFDPGLIRRVRAYGLNGEALTVRLSTSSRGALLEAPGDPALLVAEFDAGYWSKTLYGLKNLPKRKARRVVEAYRDIQAAKTVLSRGPASSRPVEGLALDIVPLTDPPNAKAKRELSVRVLFRERPLADADVQGSEHSTAGRTGPDGTARLLVGEGPWVLTVRHDERLEGDPDADFTRHTVTLSFEAAP